MIDLTDRAQVQALKSNLHAAFDTPQGQESMKFLEQIGSWYPTAFDSIDTNEVIARDANRRLLGMVKTIMDCSPDQIVALASQHKQ